MTVIDVIDCKGIKVSEKDLPDSIFNVPVKAGVLHEVVRMQLAAKRAGSASVKHRSDIRGSTKKLFRQKGTGRARRGDIKSPLLRGGGSVFGPDPRDYTFKIPKKMRKLALKMALSSKLQSDDLVILDKFELEQIRTKDVALTIQGINREDVLIIIPEKDEKLELSSRNLPKVKVLRTDGLNVYDLLKYKNLILLESSVEKIEGRFQA